MALFTDGPPSTIEELAAIDSQLLHVAAVEGIDLSQKLALAHGELGLQLLARLTESTHNEQRLWVSPQPNLGDIVVTPALQLWHCCRSLEMVYSDAYHNQLNDRYAAKRDQFHEMAKSAYDNLSQIGIGIAAAPVPRASAPQVDPAQAAPGGNLPDGTYFVAMSWLNAAGEEGAVSETAAVTTTAGTFLVRGGNLPATATRWNVYASADPNRLTLQNETPLQAGAVWVQPGIPGVTGRPPGNGQAANYTRPLPRILQRG